MSKRIAITILLAGLLLGCAAPTPVATPSVVATATVAPSNTAIRSAVTSIPTETRSPRREPTVDPTLAAAVLPAQTSTHLPRPTLISNPVAIATPVPQPKIPISIDNSSEVVELARWGKGRVSEISYSPNGKLLIVASFLGVYFYDAQTLDEFRFIEMQSRPLRIAVSSDGQMIATFTAENEIVIWRISDGKLFRSISTQFTSINDLRFSDNDQVIVGLFRDNGLYRWDLSDGKQIDITSNKYGFQSLSLDGAFVIAGNLDGSMELREIRNGGLVRKLDNLPTSLQKESIDRPVFSPNGQFIALLQRNWDTAKSFSVETITIWRVSDGKIIYTIRIPSIGVKRDVVPFKLGACRTVAIDFFGFMPIVNDYEFSPDSKLLAVRYYSGGTQVINIEDGLPIRYLDEIRKPSIFSPDSSLLVSTLESGVISLWKIEDGSILKTILGHNHAFGRIATSSNSDVVAVQGNDGKIRAYRLNDGTRLFNLDGTPMNPHSLELYDRAGMSFSPDDNFLAVAQRDGVINIYNANGGSLLRSLVSTQGFVYQLEFTADGQNLISVGDDCFIRVWRVSDGALLLTGQNYYNLPSPFDKLALQITSNLYQRGTEKTRLSPNKQITVVYSSSSIQLKNSSTNQLLREIVLFNKDGNMGLERSERGIVDLVFNVDGRLIITTSYDGTIRLWGVKP